MLENLEHNTQGYTTEKQALEPEYFKEPFPSPVYYITSSIDDTVLVGIKVRFKQSGKENIYIEWYDTTKGRRFKVEEIINPDKQHFVFLRGDGCGGEYLLIPMTLDLYQQYVQPKLMNAPLSFPDEESMIKAFLES